VYGSNTKDYKLAAIAYSQKRILLTRDTALLKRKIIMHGYLPRTQDSTSQLIEVVRLYDLSSKIKPSGRMILKNVSPGALAPLNILQILQPVIETLDSHELFMGPFLYNLSSIHDNNPVSPANS